MVKLTQTIGQQLASSYLYQQEDKTFYLTIM